MGYAFVGIELGQGSKVTPRSNIWKHKGKHAKAIQRIQRIVKGKSLISSFQY